MTQPHALAPTETRCCAAQDEARDRAETAHDQVESRVAANDAAPGAPTPGATCQTSDREARPMGIILDDPGPRNTPIALPRTRPPARICGHVGPRYRCNRPAGHTRRHSFRWYHIGGIVRGVWGEC